MIFSFCSLIASGFLYLVAAFLYVRAFFYEEVRWEKTAFFLRAYRIHCRQYLFNF